MSLHGTGHDTVKLLCGVFVGVKIIGGFSIRGSDCMICRGLQILPKWLGQGFILQTSFMAVHGPAGCYQVYSIFSSDAVTKPASKTTPSEGLTRLCTPYKASSKTPFGISG